VIKKMVVMTFLVLSILASGAAAASLTPSLKRHVTGGGGGRVEVPGYRLDATVGQPVVGTVSGGDYALCAGFWCESTYEIYLPLVLKNVS
jgi:hypothetical protein